MTDLERRIGMYALTAAGMCALPQLSEAEVIVTKTSISVPACFGIDACPVPIDINKDEITDFSFFLNKSSAKSEFRSSWLSIKGIDGNETEAGLYSAMCLAHGAKIGASVKSWASHSEINLEKQGYECTADACSLYSVLGQWDNRKNRYLGVKFKINGKIHYGWVRLTVESNPNPLSATITEYAYDTVAKQRVLAGETTGKSDATLGMLALGSEGLKKWRK